MRTLKSSSYATGRWWSTFPRGRYQELNVTEDRSRKVSFARPGNLRRRLGDVSRYQE